MLFYNLYFSMKKIILRSSLALILVVAIAFLVVRFIRPNVLNSDENIARFDSNLKEVEAFLAKNSNYNEEVVFMIDMRIPSNYHRFFVFNLKQNKMLYKGLVAHGKGSDTTVKDSLQFSNIEGSNMTSLGNYRIGGSYEGRFGKSYKLHGLDATNDQAFARYVVLHTYAFMPHEEQLIPVMRSEGCPMVSGTFFKMLETIIDTSEKPVLMRIYYN